VNEPAPGNDLLLRIVPPVAAVLLITAFAALGMWQLDRAGQKNAMAAMFADDAPATPLSRVGDVTPYQRIEARGHFLGDRQVLIDNIIRGGRVGYFVVTPFEVAPGEPLLIVNRGWVPKPAGGAALEDISVGDEWRTLNGRAGHLPRVAIKSGPAFAKPGEWPRVAVYPTQDEVSAELGREVMPFVLLLDVTEKEGFLRQWEPQQSGAMTHYGYAFQWFAMCLALIVISIWQLRRRGWRL
jgi:surfeit locus 1 family protein